MNIYSILTQQLHFEILSLLCSVTILASSKLLRKLKNANIRIVLFSQTLPGPEETEENYVSPQSRQLGTRPRFKQGISQVQLLKSVAHIGRECSI
jgi:hypothetical protein